MSTQSPEISIGRTKIDTDRKWLKKTVIYMPGIDFNVHFINQANEHQNCAVFIYNVYF